VFCASAISLAYHALYLDERAQSRKLFLTAAIILSTIMSVSSGAVAAIMTQLILIGWDWLTREMPHRWRLLGILMVAAYVTVDLISNRTPIRVGLSYLTFSEETAYGRLIIWDAGTEEVAKSPYFGIGFSEWDHPTWMSNSMDNFWLWIAVTFGLPACMALIGSVLSILYRVVKTRASDVPFRCLRKAWVFSILGVSVAGATVHFWNALFVLFMFLVGAGVFLLGAETKKPRVA
jgi:O-antigen ligase